MLARVRSNLRIADLLRAAVPGAGGSAEALERAFARRYAFPHALLFPYARVALHALLLAHRWKSKEILCPAYICAEVPYAITAAGCQVRFVDSAAHHFLPGQAEWRTAAGPNAAMAVVTPLFGYPVDKEAERSVRKAAPGMFVLYDESQSFGVDDDGGLQMRDADGALLSFGLGKMVTALSGGLLLLRDTALFHAVRALRDGHYSDPTLAHTVTLVAKGLAAWAAFREPALSVVDFAARRLRLLPASAEDWIPTHGPDLPADGKIMPSAYQAKLGLQQLARLDRFLAARRQIAQHYQDHLRAEAFRTFDYSHTPTWPRYPWPAGQRDRVVSELRRQRVQVSLFLPYSCADLPIYRDQQHACPNAALWARTMINLPNWHGMDVDQAERVVEILVRLRDRDPQSVEWPDPAGSPPSTAPPADNSRPPVRSIVP
jgi:dTDP-4-amino-4,6-dideoxygalactose transaminase